MNQDDIKTKVTLPVAEKQPYVLESGGDRRIDNYFWMRDRDNPKVRPYLEAENAYTQALMQDTETLQKQLALRGNARSHQRNRSLRPISQR